uniref:Integrase, catalytic region, zinc finger, CCHC-type, peptidase aspartic, catalytic n=1 Tax=Tanacetum cinerariifolium TaxID=118510 RepID=A0A699H9M4_TANCI|nr:integrase, catalytic region, zinc finger, CCHC-type, peptidase aspartic, catalytic [Tanacetum cinerariifolium]
MSASCPRADNIRDTIIATTPATRKKYVTFADPLETSDNNPPKIVKQQTVKRTNIPILHSIGVSNATKARRSQPKRNTTHDRTFPSNSVPKKIVKDHHRKNKSKLSKKNHVDLSCSKHMSGDRSRLRNFVKKFTETVRFGNDHFSAIMGYGNYVLGDSVISIVYYVEGLGHNLFSVGQFCDYDLEVSFRKHKCFVRDLDGFNLIKGSRGSYLYTISVEDMMRSSPICLLSKASKNKSWLWHHRLNHLNFGTINDLAQKDLVRGLPRLRFEKDHMCFACQLRKSRKATHQPKIINTIMEVLHTLHMDLCRPLRVQRINGKKYILVIVNDYSRFTWAKFLRSKDETPEFVVKLLKQLQVEAVATACYTKNRSLMHTLHNQTPYELVHDKKPDLSFLRIFGALYYPINDSEDLGKLKAKADIELFVGYVPNRKGYRIYNKRTRQIIEPIHVTFDELTRQTVPVQTSPGPTPNLMSSGLVQNSVFSTPYVPPSKNDYEILFQPLFDEYFNPSPRAVFPVPTTVAAPRALDPAGSPWEALTSQVYMLVREYNSSEFLVCAARMETHLDLGWNCFSQQFTIIDFMARFGDLLKMPIRKDGRETFGMPIPDALLTDEIKRGPYYDEYLEHVTKYQQYLNEERGKAEEGGVTESPKATKVTKPKAAKQTKPLTPKAPKHTSSQPPTSTPASTKPSKKDQGKKCKLVKETSEAPFPTK